MRGTYHGTENWSTNISLSNDKVTESITFDTSENKAYATLELYAGDVFKFDRYQNGRDIGMAVTYSIESSDNIYYPVGWADNNVTVKIGRAMFGIMSIIPHLRFVMNFYIL